MALRPDLKLHIVAGVLAPLWMLITIATAAYCGIEWGMGLGATGILAAKELIDKALKTGTPAWDDFGCGFLATLAVCVGAHLVMR